MKKMIGIGVLCMLSCISLTACSLKPTYYSEKEVREYVKDVFGEEYSLCEKTSYTNEENDDTEIYEYVFQNEDGFDFCVQTSSSIIMYEGSETLFYEKNITDDYIECKVQSERVAIEKALKSVDFDYEAKKNYLLCYIEDYQQIIDVAELMVKLDTILELNYDYSNWNASFNNSTYDFSIYLKPNTVQYNEIEDDYWKDAFECVIYNNALSHNDEERLTLPETEEDMQRSLVYKIKSTSGDYAERYEVPEQLLYQFPAEFLRLETGKATPYDFSFTYNVEDETYWMYNLDPCQNFEGVYTYSEMGSFEALVALLGGTYECEEWEATWSIGAATWEATLKVDEDEEFEQFIVEKNGEKLELDNPNGQTNGTVSGRAFSMVDLEKLLNVKFEEDRVNEIAYMLKLDSEVRNEDVEDEGVWSIRDKIGLF